MPELTDGDQLIKEAVGWASIVPGLLVSNLERSVDVYTRLFGLTLTHSEPPRLALLEWGTGQLVLQQYTPDDPLVVAELSTPFGRGVTLDLRLPEPKPLYERLRDEKWPIVVPMEIAELSLGDKCYTRTSFVVSDPDGYLLRFTD